MEDILKNMHILINILSKCKIHMNAYDYPRVSYCLEDIHMHVKHVTKIARKLKQNNQINIVQKMHLCNLSHVVKNLYTPVIAFLKKHKSYDLYDKFKIHIEIFQIIFT